MSRIESIVGKRVGKILILDELEASILPSGQKIRRYKCKCDCGIVFEASKTTIYRNKSCTTCITVEKRLAVFLKRLGEIDATVEYISGFVNYKKPILCRCRQCGKKWNTSTPDLLLRQTNISKCPDCGKIQRNKNATFSQDEFERLVMSKNPHIKITSKYIKAREPISFMCSLCNNEQRVNRASVLTEVENYCPKCNKKYRYNTNSFREEIANINADIDIIGEYISNSKKIRCRCKICGHIWEPSASNLISGTGCPECNVTGTSFVEQVLLWTFYKIYGYDNVLHRTKKVIGLELDIYIPCIKLAIEPGGWHWHRNSYAQDMLKHSLCRDKGIRCIIIYDQVYEKYTEEYSQDFWFYEEDLGRRFDKLKLVVQRILLEVIGEPKLYENLDWNEIVENAKEQNKRRHEAFMLKFSRKNKQAKNIIIKNKYFRNTDFLECECKVCGYGKKGEWKTIGHSLLNGTGCPSCRGRLFKGNTGFEEELKCINPNIKILGKYINIHTPILCHSISCGHEWMDEPRVLLQGLACPICNLGRRIDHNQFLERMKIYRPDIEIIGRYEGSRTPIACKCKLCKYGSQGEWKPIPTTLYKKKMCPNCSKDQKWKTRKSIYGSSGGNIGRKVINLCTGEIFNSIKEAAETMGVSLYIFRKYLYENACDNDGNTWGFLK